MPERVSAVISITNPHGLHARVATAFADVARQFESLVEIRRCDQEETMDGTSIIHLMMLAAEVGTKVEIIGTGTDAREAVETLVKLLTIGLADV